MHMQYSSDDTKALAQALIAVQRDMQPATKDAINPFCKNRYATFNSVMESCRDALLKHNIWLTQLPVPAPPEYGTSHIALLTKLTHADSGQWQASLTIAPLPKNDPQGMGSALTYCRRYALTAMLGIVTEDDDGEAAKIAPKMATPSRMPQNGSKFQPNQSNDLTPANTANNSIFGNLEEEISQEPDLPSIPGVSFEFVADQNGRNCILARGNTLPQKHLLAKAGFSWNPQQRVWWRFAIAS